MFVQFKYFVTEEFKKILEEKMKFNISQSENLALFRFKRNYDSEVQVFISRWNILLKEYNEKIDELFGKDFDKKTFEEKIKILDSKEESKILLKEIIENHNKKSQELLDCESELKKIEYTLISKTELTPQELCIFEGIIDNMPTS